MNRWLRYCYVFLIYALLYAPLIVVIAYSFNTSQRSLLWQGFTWKWYFSLWHDPELLTIALHSFVLAIATATIATLIGTVAATALYRYRFFGRDLMMGLTFLLIIAPDIVLAISLLILFSSLKLPLGFCTLLIAHVTFCVPFVTVIVNSKLLDLNPNTFEAAKDLGANDSTVFRRVIVPQILPGITTGWLISFTLSLDDVIISFFNTGPGFEILPLRIYSMARLGINPEVNALCSLLLGFTLIAVILAQFIVRKK